MLNKRLTSYILLFVNLVLVLFIMTRAGSEEISPHTRINAPISIQKLTYEPDYPDTLTMNDYEQPNDVGNMYPQGGEYELSLTAEHVTHGQRSLLIAREQSNNMELATVHFPRYWDEYAFLQFDLYNDSDSDGTVWLRIGSQFDNKRFYDKSQKYARSFLLKPGPNTVTIPLADVRKAFGRIPLYKSMHFNFPADGGTRYYLDYLRLVRP